ncbi:MAG: YhcB family protein [Nitrososphaera sp.]|nr:YhcB family protein [Nitrososphaera sp.]
MEDLRLWLWVTMPIMFVFGIVVGRFFSTGAKRIKALKAEIEQMRTDLDKTRREFDQTRRALEKSQSDADEYRQKVTDHFSKAADLFNSLTINYRAVYEHLAKSSINLCDEHMVMLSDSVPGDRRIRQDETRTKPQGTPRATGVRTSISNASESSSGNSEPNTDPFKK